MKKKTTTKNKQLKIKTEGTVKPTKKTADKKGYTPPSELNLNLVPYAIILAAAFFLLCMFIPTSSGWLGRIFKQFFAGLFSYGAYLIPLLLIARALNYKKEALSRYPGVNWWLSFLFLCTLACLLASIKCDSEKIFTLEHYTKAFNEKGTLTTNSLIGCIFANLFISRVQLNS